jgi:dihydroorotate dehydrogenase electron transfer subunit
LSIETPAKRRGIFAGRVARNARLCTEHYRLTLEIAGFPASSPGQFVQLECSDPDVAESVPARLMDWPGLEFSALASPDFTAARAYLRRPFSIAGRGADEGGRPWIDIIHRVVGKGTRYLEGLQPGDSISVLGPLGKGFWIPQDMETALLVGGGVGIPPMLYLADMLAAVGGKAIGFVGAQRRDLIPLTLAEGVHAANTAGEPALCTAQFARHGFETVITTDDGSLGMRGFITAALDRYLSRRKAGTVVFCCGPTPMMKATVRVAAAHGVRCFVSLEQPMACGMGTCQSCVVKVNVPGGTGEDWAYRLTCTDGPVFDAAVLRW